VRESSGGVFVPRGVVGLLGKARRGRETMGALACQQLSGHGGGWSDLWDRSGWGAKAVEDLRDKRVHRGLGSRGSRS
jgi:hypothetical protein